MVRIQQRGILSKVSLMIYYLLIARFKALPGIPEKSSPSFRAENISRRSVHAGKHKILREMPLGAQVPRVISFLLSRHTFRPAYSFFS